MNERSFILSYSELATDNTQPSMKGDDIARRLLRFAVGVLELVCRLRRDSESLYWLNLISEAHLMPTKPATQLAREGSELIAILTASAKTARGMTRREKRE